MINKKLLTAASIAAVISASSAFAKTEGNYVGLDLLRSHVKHKYVVSDGSQYKDFNDSAAGFGLNYKYAFNKDNFFVAPGVFAEKIGTKATKMKDIDKTRLNYRYGVKADIGYDVTDGLAVYFTNGLSSTNYSVAFSDDGKKSGNKLGYFYGFGLSYNVSKEATINLEYNAQSMDLNAPNIQEGSVKAETDLSVMKIGVSYHF